MVLSGMTYELDLITSRRTQITSLQAEYQAKLDALGAELAELDVAQRVIARLASPSKIPAPAELSITGADVLVTGTARKPPNIPTIPEMIMTVLNNGNPSAPPRELTPKGIAEEIRRRWWPSVTPTEISPITWRMAKRGDLVKNGVAYRLPTNPLTDPRPPEGEGPPDDEI
jgi:hypothetical protein